MPFDNVEVPQFPNIPNVPGTPTVNRPFNSTIDANTNTTQATPVDSDQTNLGQTQAQWGIYDTSGNRLIEASGTTKMDIKSDFRISTAPQEQGSFASYNKVSDPITGHMTFSQSGTLAERQACLKSVIAATGSFQAGQNLQLYTVVIPENSWPNMNLIDYNLKKDDKLNQMLLIEVWFQEVRVVGTAAFSNTAEPTGSDPVNGGQPQPQAPTDPNPAVEPGLTPTSTQQPSSVFKGPPSDASNPSTYNPTPPPPPPLPQTPASQASGGFTGENGDPIAPII